MTREVSSGQYAIFFLGGWEWECTHIHMGSPKFFGMATSEEDAVQKINAHNKEHHPHIEEAS